MDDDIDCPHIFEAAKKVKVDVEQMRTTLSNRSCNVCLRVDQLWICMECRQILCGRYALGHSTAHYEFHNNHCIFLNVESAAIFCFKCDSEVEPKTHDDELNRLRQFILYNRKPSTVAPKKIVNKRRRGGRKTIKSKKTSFKQGSSNNKIIISVNNETNSFVSAVAQSNSQQDLQGNTSNKDDLPQQSFDLVVPKKALKPVKPKKPTFKRGPRTYKKVGLLNTGNNCFMNVVYQVLSHIRPLIYCVKVAKLHEPTAKPPPQSNDFSLDSRNARSQITGELWKLLISIFDWKKPVGHKFRDAISPAALNALVCRVKPRYKGFHQHDAHEFLNFLLNNAHDELKEEKYRLMLEDGIVPDSNSKHMETIVSIMTRGYLTSEVVCLNCKTVSRTRDPYYDISLDFRNETVENGPELLTDCLDRYVEVEELNENNFYFCDKCDSEQRSTKRFWIHRLPNVLIFQLKRFRWKECQRTKVHTPVKFPLTSLDMFNYLDSETQSKSERCNANLFDLSAVIVHEGEGGGSGHYTAFCLDDKTGEWFEFNDTKVNIVDASAVENVQAYLLFYIRKEIKLNFKI